MSRLLKVRRDVATGGGPRLSNGDTMKQPEFHRLYLQQPSDETFELVEGVVFVASPVRLAHSDYHGAIGLLLKLYSLATDGVQTLHNATTVLGEESEPQPDLGMRIRPEYGGTTRTEDGYLVGAPELVVEIADSTRALDMHGKKRDYRKAGVAEYIVLCIEEREVHLFDFAATKPIVSKRDGIGRSQVFPGLWLYTGALVNLDKAQAVEVVNQGIASTSHAAFVKRLRSARRKRGSNGGA